MGMNTPLTSPRSLSPWYMRIVSTQPPCALWSSGSDTEWINHCTRLNHTYCVHMLSTAGSGISLILRNILPRHANRAGNIWSSHVGLRLWCSVDAIASIVFYVPCSWDPWLSQRLLHIVYLSLLKSAFVRMLPDNHDCHQMELHLMLSGPVYKQRSKSRSCLTCILTEIKPLAWIEAPCDDCCLARSLWIVRHVRRSPTDSNLGVRKLHEALDVQ